MANIKQRSKHFSLDRNKIVKWIIISVVKSIHQLDLSTNHFSTKILQKPYIYSSYTQ